VFSSKDTWKYRSNEFSNDSFDRCEQALLRQSIALPFVFSRLGVDRSAMTRYNVTIERMHAIWPFRHKTGRSL